MISGNFKRLLAEHRIKGFANRRKSSGINSSTGLVGMILDTENLEEKFSLMDFHRSLDVSRYNFKLVICGEQVELPEGVEAEFLNRSDISFIGKFKTESIENFANETFDCLICNYNESSWTASLLAAVTTARIKIGVKPDVYNIFDVEINTGDIQIFRQEALKYLKILKSNS
ncbi:DUF6913 domain-containing protein [Christiangramia salexigens]|uniref:Glycosyltransferase n=1 Tax=Christiangramia salexigens TaxID=1913577 RepID=A0A1L3J1I6_9FLAO|nr:hypothetical protein [Christiangramia salexigens]APG58983.1 hypothetical protein LPB144_00555 [Christiangramia salexigens]